MTDPAQSNAKRVLSVLFLATGLGTFLLASACSSRTKTETSHKLPMGITVSVIATKPIVKDFPVFARLPGTVIPYQMARIHAQVTGYLKSVRVDLGSRVKKGDILAEIDVPELHNHFMKALADYQYRLILLNRYRRIIRESPDLVSQEEVDQTRNMYMSSLAHLHQLVSQLQFSVIRSPYDGIVTRRYVDPGALVGPMTTGGAQSHALFRVDDLQRVRVEIDIPQRYVNEVHIGSPATISFPGRLLMPDGAKQPVHGQIALISHALNPASKTMPVQGIFDNPGGILKPGMFIRVLILLHVISNTLTIPDNALVERNGLMFVYVVDKDGAIEERRIRTGEDNGIRIEVKDGLSPNDVIVVSGKHQVLPGDRPRIQFQSPSSGTEEMQEAGSRT